MACRFRDRDEEGKKAKLKVTQRSKKEAVGHRDKQRKGCFCFLAWSVGGDFLLF